MTHVHSFLEIELQEPEVLDGLWADAIDNGAEASSVESSERVRRDLHLSSVMLVVVRGRGEASCARRAGESFVAFPASNQ